MERLTRRPAFPRNQRMDTKRLQAEVQRFDPKLAIEEASTPPSSWYTSPAFWALERRAVFARTWQQAGRLEQLEAEGSFISGEIGGVHYLVATR